MNGENLPLLLILVLAVIGDNTSVSVAVLVLLLIKFLGLGSWLPVIQNHGLNLGIIILTVGVLAPLAQGGVSQRIYRVHFYSRWHFCVLDGRPRCAIYAGDSGSGHFLDRRNHYRRLLFSWIGDRTINCRRTGLFDRKHGATVPFLTEPNQEFMGISKVQWAFRTIAPAIRIMVLKANFLCYN